MALPLLIGSAAHTPHSGLVCPRDLDFIGTTRSITHLFSGDLFSAEPISAKYPINKNHIVQKHKDGTILEAEYAFTGNSATDILNWFQNNKEKQSPFAYDVATPILCWMLKESHKYKPGVHFEKTRNDVLAYRRMFMVQSCKDAENELDKVGLLTILKKREEETYREPVKLMVSKEEFFADDGVPYIIDHDLLHDLVAIGPEPAYKKILKPGEAVYCDKSLWDKASTLVKDRCVIEEAMAIALERAVIPFDLLGKVDDDMSDRIFKRALQCICTTLCSGWFREYAWENYDRLLKIFQERDYTIHTNFCQLFDVKYKLHLFKSK